MSKSQASAFDRFLTPESMITPGAAGGATMLIANTLAHNFGVDVSITGLGLSFLFGLLAVATVREWWLRGVYYVLNSLIIFCVAFGSGNLAAPSSSASPKSASLDLVSPAYAEENPAGQLQTLRENYKQLDSQYNTEVNKLAALQREAAPQSEIHKQNQVIADLQQKKSENLDAQAKLIAQLADTKPREPAAKPSSGFFQQWHRPF